MNLDNYTEDEHARALGRLAADIAAATPANEPRRTHTPVWEIGPHRVTIRGNEVDLHQFGYLTADQAEAASIALREAAEYIRDHSSSQ